MSEEQRFLPAGLIVVSAMLVVGGLAFSVIATPALVIRGGLKVSFFGAVLFETTKLVPGIFGLAFKALLGFSLVGMAIGLLRLHEPSRRGVIAFLVIIGILIPLLLSFELDRIDQVFVKILRLAMFTISSICVYYLTRERIVQVFVNGGLSAHLVYRYCPICSTRGIDEGLDSCPHCEGDLLDRYETDCGLVFARSVAVQPKEA